METPARIPLFVEAFAPDVKSAAERQRDFRAANPVRDAATKTRYRHNNSKWKTDVSYLSTPFIAWDGEGITDTDGTHRYVMLAVKTETSDAFIGRVEGLGTAEIFEFILNFVEDSPKGINVIYGGGYDFNMFMRDIDKDTVRKIYKEKYAVWQNYRIGWRPGKSFYLCRVNSFNRKRLGTGVTMYDTVSFFQCAFVKACDDYLGERFYEREMIVSNKALRSSFTDEDIPVVREYNDAELTNLLALMSELRIRLNKCGLRPRRWDGPGAVASALMLREGVKGGQAVCPPRVARAARFAYAGGRFEVVRFGHVQETVYEYDINSAYPSALRDVPDLNQGKWKHVKGDPGPADYALYHVAYHGNSPELPGAFFRRDSNGTICYPLNVTGWYWSPEVETGRLYCEAGYGEITILEAYVFVPSSDAKPFAFIDGLYNKRRALKKAGDGAHVGIKLALNSLYGKTAQQIGWERKEDGSLRIPPFHQLEWAGYITSACRAKILRACLSNLEAVIAFETDAVFSSVPLDVKVGSDLGDFEQTTFDDLTYVQSGLYFASSEGEEIVKTRGVDRGTLTRDLVLARLQEPLAKDRVAVARLTRFVGAGVALAQSWDRWRKWETADKNMTLEPSGKRVHKDCVCKVVVYDQYGNIVNKGLEFGYWHYTVCPYEQDTHSAEFPIEWINPDPLMAKLDESRQEPNDYDFD